MTAFVRPPGWRQRFGVPFIASITLLGFTFVNFLNYNSYPIWKFEVGYIVGVMVLLCAGMAALYSGQRLWARAFMEAILIGVVTDLNANSLWVTAAAACASLVFVVVTRRSLLPFAAVMGSVMLMLGLGGFGGRPAAIETKAPTVSSRGTAGSPAGPAIVHLILDEHTGFEGFPRGNAAASLMRAKLRDFYGSRGFAMFGRAYSEHYLSANSIPQILNLGGLPPRHENPKHFVRVGPTRYLTMLSRQGYTIRLYQNKGYLDLCGSTPVAHCTEYSSTLSLPESSLSSADRAKLLAFKFLALSEVLLVIDSRSRPLLGVLSPPEPVYPPLERLGWTNTLASLAMLDRLAADLRNARPGEAYIAHLLVPHVPSIVDERCNVLPVRDWDRRIQRVSVEQRQIAYYKQIQCTLQMTDKLLHSLAQSPAGSNSTVLVHGDHGSRLWRNIPDKRFYRKSTDADYIAAFSTLFAVRSKQIPARYVEQPSSVADLLRQLSDSGFSELPQATAGPPMVYLADANWRPWKRVALPESWWKNSSATQRGSNSTD